MVKKDKHKKSGISIITAILLVVTGITEFIIYLKPYGSYEIDFMVVFFNLIVLILFTMSAYNIYKEKLSWTNPAGIIVLAVSTLILAFIAFISLFGLPFTESLDVYKSIYWRYFALFSELIPIITFIFLIINFFIKKK